MLEILNSGEDVLAVCASNKITGTDLEVIMDRLDEVMTERDKVHIFIETHAIDSIELEGLLNYMKRAAPLFGKLDRFGRVAVVADQAWIRLGTRLESALLPWISYRTYMPGERDKALAWVEGNNPTVEA